ncbi:restriction endonuclease [Brachyspira hyodysenteriae]|uniref:Restriction endonuclease n=1 Tax=Brachyspira hyodysenteriae ATCC 27164 TaxID=1266923 RepID=A0A3B6VRG5_BRAHO|nr:restriction endonuclease [Brachyspira hyodysenteriae]ANN63357.1 restriction endonuclease [Brachyspira hyodysenteriae ATCC 27164]KLI14509.1 restriction endonuclease [Brachyspira hyodysenteriae]KLI24417.1 restriction endonuclease [Brachyspira hyodysenteriae]KLI47390.1 restriction endonuclease [Brachyspira hyodysenteriae]MCZ9901867.1 restriction endonuclease [Brachyspira hyodysenteriae]
MALLVTEDYCKYVLKFFYEVNEAVHRSKTYEKIKEYSNTSDEDYNIVYQNVKSSKNGYSKFKDKIHWNLTFLKQAELIENVDRGVYQITDFGKKFYEENPNFDFKTLKEKTPYLINIKHKDKNNIEENNNKELEEDENRNEIEKSIEEYYESVEKDILDRLQSMGDNNVDKGTKFENICLELLEKMGYGKKYRTGGSGDRGIDGTLTMDKFGFDMIGIQCKCYKENNKVNDTEITKFAHGLKNVNGINRGIFITTSDYTPQAKKVVEELKDIKIILINGYRLAKYMREYEVGVKVLETRNIYDVII